MFKDPYDHNESPYELLGIEPNTSIAAVQAALPRFMREPKNRSRVGRAQDALKKLKRPIDRAAVDVWLYDIDDVVPDLRQAADANPWLEAFRAVPVYGLQDLSLALAQADAAIAHPVIERRDMPVELTQYDSLSGAWAVTLAR